jgi:hypothetical protein
MLAMNSLNTVGSDLEPDPEEIDPGVRMYESADHVSNTVAVFIGGTFSLYVPGGGSVASRPAMTPSPRLMTCPGC